MRRPAGIRRRRWLGKSGALLARRGSPHKVPYDLVLFSPAAYDTDVGSSGPETYLRLMPR